MAENSVDDRLTCILCPVGCEIEVKRGTKELDLKGYQCEKGIDFATEEVLRPLRNLATSVPLKGSETLMVSVRLSGRVPRDMLFPILEKISRLRPDGPVRRGQVLIPNVLGTGADVIATRTVRSDEPGPTGQPRGNA